MGLKLVGCMPVTSKDRVGSRKGMLPQHGMGLSEDETHAEGHQRPDLEEVQVWKTLSEPICA